MPGITGAVEIAAGSSERMKDEVGDLLFVVANLARRLSGPLHAAFLPLAAGLGAGLLLASDLVARTLLGSQELPVGIVTAGIGALFVMALLRRRATD